MTSGPIEFYVGLHQPSDGKHFDRACISINRLLVRKKPVGAKLIVDSGAFTELERNGKYRHSVGEYAAQLYRLWSSGAAEIVAAVAQDYMCEPFMLAKTKATGASDGTIDDHQRLTIERYDDLLVALCDVFRVNHPNQLPFHVLPALQGYAPEDYARHIRAYGDRLTPDMWVGVGSVCKRNGNPAAVAAVLSAAHRERPDLKFHVFGVKKTSLADPRVRNHVHTADSMAWSDSARHQGRNANDWREAAAFLADIDALGAVPQHYQYDILEDVA